ncbi:DUF1579 domain-containing protein [Roseomonas stagni]|uniref:DUF1579 domain-containing protein n=1 Tax=Falsiroseomonas algicola TaxID=2716930 RepID=A0A6M1LKC5_9PROT|nr:DUF1579 domain-containing protein [Falsiroseomonas algicola]NGM20429.1 DUF1579 domain-containing protein [Falsiroseomonas algicola]
MSGLGASERDFDFEFGVWRVSHRRLRQRLVGCQDWDSFDGTAAVRPVLGGHGNIEDNVLAMPQGIVRAIAIRSFDAQRGLWAIWWLSSANPLAIDAPVVGRFESGVGTFVADETVGGRAVRTRFLWLDTRTAWPRWEQAQSADGGATWETNWTMTFERVEDFDGAG